MADKIPGFVTEVVDCRWSNLSKPDVEFGEASANHNITVVVDEPLNKKLQEILKKSGAKKINGLKEKDGVTTLKAKTKSHIEKGSFPCFDSQAKPSEVVAMGGDRVKLRLQPVVLSRDKSLSLYLNGVQIVHKGERSGSSSGGFTSIEGGFVSSPSPSKDIPTTDEELPF
jgi:hypothetical protein